MIEQIHSQKAKPENMIFSPDRKTLLIEYFDVPPGFTDEITLTFSLELYQRKSNVSLSREKPYDKQASVYLKHINPPGTISDPKLQKHLHRIGVDAEKSVIRNVQKIYRYLGKQLRYGSYASDEPVPNDLLEGGKGHCGIYANFFVDLCRQANIPARRCAGFLLAEDADNPSQTTVSAHNWAEFYVEGIGWIPVDPIMGDKPDQRQKYYFGNMDNAHLCVSKENSHYPLPIWYKDKKEKILFTDDIDHFKSGLYPETIQGAHRVQYRWDKPIQISVLNAYGAENLKILSRQGTFKMPKTP